MNPSEKKDQERKHEGHVAHQIGGFKATSKLQSIQEQMELKEAKKYIDEHHGLPQDISDAIPLLLSGAGQIPEHAKTESDLRNDQKKYLKTLAKMNHYLS